MNATSHPSSVKPTACRRPHGWEAGIGGRRAPHRICVDADRSSFRKRLSLSPQPPPPAPPTPPRPLRCLRGRTQVPRQGGRSSALVGHPHTKLGALCPHALRRAHDAQCVAEPMGHVGLSMHRHRTEPRLGSQGASAQGPGGRTEWTEAQLPRTPARNMAARRPTSLHPMKTLQTRLQAGTLSHRCRLPGRACRPPDPGRSQPRQLVQGGAQSAQEAGPGPQAPICGSTAAARPAPASRAGAHVLAGTRPALPTRRDSSPGRRRRTPRPRAHGRSCRAQSSNKLQECDDCSHKV